MGDINLSTQIPDNTDNTQSQSSGVFDMNAIIQSQSVVQESLNENNKQNISLQSVLDRNNTNIIADEVIEKKAQNINIIKYIWYAVLWVFTIIALYFSATIFYPVELQNIQTALLNATWILKADIVWQEQSLDQTNKIDDGISTPIADSIANNNSFDESSFTSGENQEMRDTILPQESTIENTSTANGEIIQATESNSDSNELTIQTDTLDHSFDNLQTAFGLSQQALDEYIKKLDDIRVKVEIKESDYKSQDDNRGLAITKTLYDRIDTLVTALKSEDNEKAISNIDEDIAQINKLLEVIGN